MCRTHTLLHCQNESESRYNINLAKRPTADTGTYKDFRDVGKSYNNKIHTVLFQVYIILEMRFLSLCNVPETLTNRNLKKNMYQ